MFRNKKNWLHNMAQKFKREDPLQRIVEKLKVHEGKTKISFEQKELVEKLRKAHADVKQKIMDEANQKFLDSNIKFAQLELDVYEKGLTTWEDDAV